MLTPVPDKKIERIKELETELHRVHIHYRVQIAQLQEKFRKLHNTVNTLNETAIRLVKTIK